MMISTVPVKNVGTENPMNATVVATWSKIEYCLTADRMPIGIASTSVEGSTRPQSSLAAASRLRPLGDVPHHRVPPIRLDALKRFALAVSWLCALDQPNHDHVLNPDVVHLDDEILAFVGVGFGRV